MGKSVGYLTIMFGANLKGFERSMRKAQKSINRFGESMKNTGRRLTTSLTLPILGLGVASVKLASDYEESLNKVRVSFGGASKTVEDFAKTTLKAFGIAEGSALEMASLFGDMGTSMGLSQKSASEMSTELVGLVGDLASFKNIKQDIAKTALASVFTGETESLKKLGIIMTQANLQQFAFEQGIMKSVKSMTQAEIVQLRFSFVMSKSENALGDYLATSDGVANSSRTLTESIKELGQKFGVILIPFAKKIIIKFQSLINHFNKLSLSQKNSIIKWLAITAAIGPVIMILGTLITSLNSVIAVLIRFSALIIANPMIAAAAAVILYVGALKLQFNQLTANQKALKQLQNIRKNALESTKEERDLLQKKLSIAQDVNRSEKERIGAINFLNQKVRSLNGQLSLQNINQKNLTKSIKEYSNELIRQAQITGGKEGLVEAIKTRDKLKTSVETLQKAEDNATSGKHIITEMLKDANIKYKDQVIIVDELTLSLQKLEGKGGDLNKVITLSQIKNTKYQNSVNGLNQKLSELQVLYDNAIKGSKEYNEIAGLIILTQSQLNQLYKDISVNIKSTKEATELLTGATALFGDVIFDSFMRATESQNNFFSSFIENIKKAIKSLVIQLAVLTAINMLLGGKGVTMTKAFSAAKLKILGLASGGLVTGPTLSLLGEGSGTSISNPEVVAPLDKLKGMISTNDGGSQQVEVYGRISGNDIFISNQRGSLNRLRSV